MKTHTRSTIITMEVNTVNANEKPWNVPKTAPVFCPRTICNNVDSKIRSPSAYDLIQVLVIWSRITTKTAVRANIASGHKHREKLIVTPPPAWLCHSNIDWLEVRLPGAPD